MILKLIPKQVIIYLVVTTVSLAVGAFGGYTFCKRAQYKGVINQQQKDAVVVLKHEVKKDVVDEKINKAVEKLNATKGACLTAPSDDDYLNELQRADSIAESEFN